MAYPSRKSRIEVHGQPRPSRPKAPESPEPRDVVVRRAMGSASPAPSSGESASLADASASLGASAPAAPPEGGQGPAAGEAGAAGARPQSGAPDGSEAADLLPDGGDGSSGGDGSPGGEGAPGADASSYCVRHPALDRLRDYMKGLVGPGRRFASLRKMGEALGMDDSRMSVLYKFLSCSVDPRASLVLGWLEKLGVPVDYAASSGNGVDFLPVLAGKTGAGTAFPMPRGGEVAGYRAVDAGIAGIIGVSLGECCFLDVTDDTMEPLFRKGSSLVVDFSDAARRYPVEGRIYLVRHADSVLVRRLRFGRGSLVLSSENPLDRPVTIGPEDLGQFELLGRVRWYSSAV